MKRGKPVTLVFAYYENPGMLERQLDNIASYDPGSREHVRLIVVDDGSPQNPAKIGSCAVPHKLFRCLVDVKWNQHACRNLGVNQAETEWVVMTDMDHLIPIETVRALIEARHSARCAYRFARLLAPELKPHKPHVNSWFMTRTLFDEVGGYDERLTGIYGTDFDFRARVRARARIVPLKNTLVLVPLSLVPDAATTRYTRTVEADRAQKIVRDRGSSRPLRLTFPWERVE